MKDLEFVRICAERMGLTIYAVNSRQFVVASEDADECEYNPLTNDAQCMAIVKRFRLDIRQIIQGNDTHWMVMTSDTYPPKAHAIDPDLNRAVCLCVARMK